MATLRLESVSFKAGGARLLAETNLLFRSGQLTGILGPSGSGKSTLLKCLTTIHKPTAGRVTLDGEDVWAIRRRFRLSLGYVPQDDVIHPQLTVEQAFLFSSRLRLDTAMAPEAVAKRVDAVAALLGLAEARKRRIFRLSGGQRKRVNIGIELLADPEVLVLDEPASGLDPGTEEDLVKLLGALAGAGRTVVMTTHSMEYLSSLHRIVVLAAGNVLFWGGYQDLLAHFQVPHAADVFKAIRGKGVDSWAALYRSSQLARKAEGP
ncbi:MAG: ABC transporter ATP-binding protein [Elusimicrobia bacterium]|nr:ABC transporter ATP-binding protein [Elusimicrobiota bacterium]